MNPADLNFRRMSGLHVSSSTTPIASCLRAAHRRIGAVAILLSALASLPAHADKRYGPGVTDTEIKIGQTMPYSGPLSAFGTIGRAEAAYFEMVNLKGGVNGRKIRLISLDDGYSPPKAREKALQRRSLIVHTAADACRDAITTPASTSA